MKHPYWKVDLKQIAKDLIQGNSIFRSLLYTLSLSLHFEVSLYYILYDFVFTEKAPELLPT